MTISFYTLSLYISIVTNANEPFAQSSNLFVRATECDDDKDSKDSLPFLTF